MNPRPHDVTPNSGEGSSESHGVAGDYTVKSESPSISLLATPEQSEWICYLFGNRPGGVGVIYRPRKGGEPHWFARWMMRVCFDCLWVKDKK